MAGGKGSDSDLNEILEIMNERQQIAYNELLDVAANRGIDEGRLNSALDELKSTKVVEGRSSGGIMMYYLLQQQEDLRKVLIVEDDKNINKLMGLSIGKGFEITQIYDGGQAMALVRNMRPDLVILDLMLPHKDGLDICQTIKSDPMISNTIVILVSAMDPTSNRFKGIKYGADYYIKKPFDPAELKSLVTIFLKKKGKRFDPLIDLPNEERISNEIEHSIKSDSQYTIGKLKVVNLAEYAKSLGEKSALVILRLISQLLQDIIEKKKQDTFVGFLNSESFIIAGDKEGVQSVVEELKQEFNAVMPFILQDEGYRDINLDIESLFETNEVPRLQLVFEPSERDKILKKRNEILKSKKSAKADIGSYTYEELRSMLGSDDIDLTITRDSNGVKLQVSKGDEE
ncbi:MAG: response regulator [Candidatus Micrarchaeota archaeon]|nr:response regulator [Candidatus Micrarchaeota archaeon]